MSFQRTFLMILGVFVATSMICSSVWAKTSDAKRPNIIFIMSDDHTSQAVSAYGGMLADVCPTPNIDRLAKEGMLFKNCFVTNSICTPSRAAILTGKYSHKNGVYKFTAMDHSQPTLPKMMQKGGYETSLIGKYHLASNPVGFDYFFVLPGQGSYHNPIFIQKGDDHPSGYIQRGEKTMIEGHSTDAITDQALDYLKHKRGKDKPFMLLCHYKAPHDTWDYAERYESFLEDVDIPEPSNLFDDYEGRSDMLKKQLQYIGSEWGNHTNFEEETEHLKGKAKKKMQYQLYMKKYLRCVKGVDDNVGRILDYLDKAGLAENTIVMYTGDQGFFLGEHGLYDKRIMYEEALRMPFLVRWPAGIKAGSQSDGMILNIDFAPTMLQAAGVKPHPKMQGKSFVSLLKGDVPSDWRTSMYYRYYYSHFQTESHYGVRTHEHKLIYFDRIKQWELYDLKKDPQEMNNVYDDPKYQTIVKTLKKELKRLQKELGDDPKDVGDNPNIGALAAQPRYVTSEVDMGKPNSSIVVEFRTRVGGTIISKCNLSDDLENGDANIDAMKMLTISNKGLSFFYGGEDPESIDVQLMDNRRHTLALVLRDHKPTIYVNGEQVYQSTRSVPEDDASHTFNIGAGQDDSGWLGYNYQGEISNIRYYRKSLSPKELQMIAKGKSIDVKATMSWSD